MAAGYLLDLAGQAMSPPVLAMVALVAAGGVIITMRNAPVFTREASIFLCVTALSGAYLLFLASPSLLPVTDGPDVVHHLQLIHLIQRTHRLAHDAALYPYLLEMMNYTPGSHVLAAAAGDWLRVDALRVLQPIAASFIAVKIGMLYLLARRAGAELRCARVTAPSAALLAFVPSVYTIGSTFRFFFYAQVVSETFAVGMLLAASVWLSTGRRACLAWFAMCGLGVFLSWPVWIGPGVAALGAALLAARVSWRERVRAGLIAVGPVAVVIAVFVWGHAEGGRILASAGAVTEPSVAAFGVAFLVCVSAGVAFAVRRGRAIPVVTFLAVTLLQAGTLALLAVRAGTHGFYMPFKMIYLAVLPAAVLGALALMRLADALVRRRPRWRLVAASAPLFVALLMLAGRVPLAPQRSPITPSALAAGEWARAHVDPACVDYLTVHWLTGYWLHLDVLGNPRLSDRMREETFEFRDVAGKWIAGRGLRYAIVERPESLPRELRPDLTVLAAFPPFAVLQNPQGRGCR